MVDGTATNSFWRDSWTSRTSGAASVSAGCAAHDHAGDRCRAPVRGGAIVADFYQLDGLSGRAATPAASAWRQTPASRPVLNAVDGVVSGAAQVERVEISQAEATVAVSLRRAPAVLVLDRIPALRKRLAPTVTRQAALTPEGL